MLTSVFKYFSNVFLMCVCEGKTLEHSVRIANAFIGKCIFEEMEEFSSFFFLFLFQFQIIV